MKVNFKKVSFFVLIIISFVFVHVCAIELLPEFKEGKIILDRISVNRINELSKQYEKRLYNAKKLQKILYCSGGIAAGFLIYLCVKLLCGNLEGAGRQGLPCEINMSKVTDEQLKRAECFYYNIDSERLKYELDEIRKNNEERRTLWGSIRRGVYHGIDFAVYSSIAAAILWFFSMAKDDLKKRGRYFFSLDDREVFEAKNGKLKDVCNSFDHLLGETSEGLSKLKKLKATEGESSAVRSVRYLYTDFVVHYMDVVWAIEGICSVALMIIHFDDNKDKRDILMKKMGMLILTTQCFGEILERALNANEPEMEQRWNEVCAVFRHLCQMNAQFILDMMLFSYETENGS